MRDAMRALRAVAGMKEPAAITADDLCACQQWMIRQGNLSRDTINARINRIRRVFRWARRPPQRWVPVEVLVDLEVVEPLAWGRTPAAERNPVEPVSWTMVSPPPCG
jgi:hypothetical protein